MLLQLFNLGTKPSTLFLGMLQLITPSRFSLGKLEVGEAEHCCDTDLFLCVLLVQSIPVITVCGQVPPREPGAVQLSEGFEGDLPALAVMIAL